MSPRLFSCWLLAAITAWLGVAATAAEQKLSYPEHDVAITAPEGWISPKTPPGAVVQVQHPGGRKTAVLMASVLPDDVQVDPDAFVFATRLAIKQQGGFIVGSGEQKIGELLFQTTKIGNSAGARPLSYMCTTFANNRAVSLMLSSDETDPSTDPELNAILQSLHFLSPLRPIPTLTGWEKVRITIDRHQGLAVSCLVLFIGVIATFLMLLVKRRQARRAE